MTIDRDTLREVILAPGELAFAVLDGARFESLPDTIRDADIGEARCLYLDKDDDRPELSVTAP